MPHFNVNHEHMIFCCRPLRWSWTLGLKYGFTPPDPAEAASGPGADFTDTEYSI